MTASLVVTLSVVAARADPQAASAPAEHDAQRPKLLIAGFEPQPDGDPRDAWIAIGLEELLAYRLRRVPQLLAIPTIRVYQARRELQGPASEPPTWPDVAGALGAEYVLRGRCSGPAARVQLELTLRKTADPGEGERVTFAAGRVFEVLDEATRWVLARFELSDLPATVAQRVLAPPSRSVTAIESHARAVTALRTGNLREALRRAREALSYDRRLRPAQALLAQIESRAGLYREAAVGWRILAGQARQDDDPLDRAHAELGQSLLLQLERAFDPALMRAETALAITVEQRDLYGQIAAMNVICDLYLSRQPPLGAKLSPEDRRKSVRENLTQAAARQRDAIDLLNRLGDRVATLPATNKLALIYEQLQDNQRALQMHQQTLAVAKELGSTRHQASSWMFIAQCHRKQQQWAPAVEALQSCLALAEPPARPGVLILLGGLYLDMEQPEEALRQFETANAQLQNSDELLNQFTCLRQTALAQMQLGRRAEALQTLQEAIDLAHVLELADEAALREQLDTWRSNTP